jgi:hypothetical protein
LEIIGRTDKGTTQPNTVASPESAAIGDDPAALGLTAAERSGLFQA